MRSNLTLTYSFRKPAKNLADKDRYLFKHEMIRKFPKSSLSQLKWLIVDSNLNVYNKKFTPNPRLTINNLPIIRLAFKIFKSLIKNKIVISTSPTCLIVDNWSYGYFHWLHDVLPKLISIKEKCSNYGIILPKIYKEIQFVDESLNYLGIDKVLYLEEGYIYLFKKVYYPTELAPTGNYNDFITSQLREVLLKKITLLTVPCKRVYISRRLALRRSISNEEILISILKKYNFDIVLCENLTFAEQLHLFYKTEILISNHGAGLSNMLFMQKGTKVMELRANGDSKNNCYFSLASALDLQYFYQLCSKENESESVHIANIIVNPQSFEETIKLLLK